MFDFILKFFLIFIKKLLLILLDFKTFLIEYKSNDVVFPDWIHHQYHPKVINNKITLIIITLIIDCFFFKYNYMLYKLKLIGMVCVPAQG